MTTKQLVDLIVGYRWFNDEKIRIAKGEVYLAAHFAQLDMCRFGYFLEDYCTLGLAAGQERYKFSPLTITGASNTAPIEITIAGHNFHTGDEIFIVGVEGNTNANGRWKIEKTGDDTFTLIGSIGNAGYTTGGTAYHLLLSVLQIKGDLRKLTPNEGRIEKRDKYQIDAERHYFGTSSPAEKVLYWYEVHGQSIEVGFQGVPAVAMEVEILFYRKPQEFERIDAEVDPILPPDYDKLLYSGTMYHLLDLMDHPKAESQANRWLEKFLGDMVSYGGSAVKQRISYHIKFSKLEWK
jgi:hypothetical protein